MAQGVAVIIPLHNGYHYIRQTLDAVFSQSLPAAEVVVVDDGSIDGSIPIVTKYPNVRLLRNPGNGANQARNFGLEQTRAPFVAFLDQDDVWHPDFLKVLSGLLDRYPEYQAAFSDWRLFRDIRDLEFDPVEVNPSPFDPWQNFPLNHIASPSCAMVRREALDSIGGWPTEYRAAADVHLWYRLSIQQPLLRNPHKTAAYRLHENSWSHISRANEVKQYFGEFIRSSRDAMACHNAVYPQEAERLGNRYKALTSLSGVLVGLLDSNTALLSNSARALEEYLSHEPAEYTEAMCGSLFWFLGPLLRNVKISVKLQLLGVLSATWPEESKYTRKLILKYIDSMMSPKTYLRYVVENPFQWRRWKQLAITLHNNGLPRSG